MTYKVLAVSKTIRDFSSKFGDMKSYKLKLEGVEMAVELAQKAETPAPTMGMTLEGTIDMSGEYGPKFKKDFQGGGGKFGGAPKDQSAIKAQFAIKAAVALAASGQIKTDDIEAQAIDFFDMVERVKATEKTPVVEKDEVIEDPFAKSEDEMFPDEEF